MIILQHGGNITTLYGHMSKFGNARVGARVKQGDVIGYVGKSGLATGPHLHYEYRVNGAHRNPRTVPLPPADPVPAEYQDDFRTATDTLWRQLDLYQVQPRRSRPNDLSAETRRTVRCCPTDAASFAARGAHYELR